MVGFTFSRMDLVTSKFAMSLALVAARSAPAQKESPAPVRIQDPRAVVRRLPDGGEERLHRLAVNRVAPLGAVDGDALDAVLKCDEQFLRTVGHRYYSLPK